MKPFKILLIGGGTGGHIFPLRPLINDLKEKNIECEIVVNDATLDEKIIRENFSDTPTYFIQTGKIRRYLSWDNLKDFYKVILSIQKAREILKESKADALFFKGGFVGFPFLIASKFLFPRFKGPLFAHESDISEGIMTRLIGYFTHTSFKSFDTESPFPLFYEPEKKSEKTQKQNKQPQILIFGGSQGAQFINTLIEENQDELLEKYTIILVSGIGKKIKNDHPNFHQYDFLPIEELSHFIQTSDLIISRAGANSLFEILSAKKLSIIIPLPSVARNHQMLNARFFEKQNLCTLLEQNEKAQKMLPNLIERTLQNTEIKKNLQKSNIRNRSKDIAKTIHKTLQDK